MFLGITDLIIRFGMKHLVQVFWLLIACLNV